jgi:hypothetical protein
MKKSLWLIILMIVSMLGACSSNDSSSKINKDTKKETSVSASSKKDQNQKKTINFDLSLTWQENIEKIVSSNATAQDKVFTVYRYSQKYPVKDTELKEFESYIIGEYKNGNYLKNPKDELYMLTNSFKAGVITNCLDVDGSGDDPYFLFATFFSHNSNGVFLGDKTDSSEVKETEAHLDEQLKEIER